MRLEHRSVVTSELPGTPAPANAAAVDGRTIVDEPAERAERHAVDAPRNTAVTAL